MPRILIVLALFSSTAHAEPIEVFVLAGQSNATWRQGVGSLPLVLQQQTWLYRPWVTGGLGGGEPAAGFSTYDAVGQGWGPEATLGDTLADSLGPDQFAIVHFSQGGTSLYYDWNVTGPVQGDVLYAACVAFVRESLAQLVEAGYEPQLKAVFWVQGEDDAGNFNPANIYGANLNAFIAGLQSELLHPFSIADWEANYGTNNWDGDDFLAWQRSTPPEFYATLLHEDGYRPYTDLVRQRQQESAATIVSVDDMPLLSDGLHHAPATVMANGARLASAYLGATVIVVPEPCCVLLALLALACLPRPKAPLQSSPVTTPGAPVAGVG